MRWYQIVAAVGFYIVMLACFPVPARSQDAPGTEWVAQLDELEACMLDKAEAWHSGPDPARDIAEAARSACSGIEMAISQQIRERRAFPDERREMEWDKLQRETLEAVASGLQRRVMRLVIEKRGG